MIYWVVFLEKKSPARRYERERRKGKRKEREKRRRENSSYAVLIQF